MGKMVILALYFFLIGCYTAVASANRFSAGFSPSISINRVYCLNEPRICDKGAAIRMHFGAAYNFSLQEHCNLSTGLSYALGHIGLVRPSDGPMPSINEEHLLQSIWIPVLFRFDTSEVMIDTNIYCKLGLVPSIYLPTRPIAQLNPEEVPFINTRQFGCFMLLGSGIKYDFSLANSLTFGLSYCWDLIGIMYKKDTNSGEIYCHNNFICLDFYCLF